MKRVLLTGMSGTGKSAVVAALSARGYRAFDSDDGWTQDLPDGTRCWDENAVRALLDTGDADILFFAGCEENMVVFLPSFDHVILLSAPIDTMLQRLATRTDNPFGKSDEELGRILDDLESVEPRLRSIADDELVTTAPLDEVVSAILRLVEG